MNVEFINEPFQVLLFGFGATFAEGQIPETGKRLMDKMWSELQSLGTKTKGINHWVYLPNSRIFSGVQLVDQQANHGSLERLEVSLDRYLRYVHLGEYNKLPKVWAELITFVKQHGMSPRYPNLEVYGHWNSDPAKCETTILIGLDAKGCALVENS